MCLVLQGTTTWLTSAPRVPAVLTVQHGKVSATIPMRLVLRMALAGLLCGAVAVALVAWMTSLDSRERTTPPERPPEVVRTEQKPADRQPPAEPPQRMLRVIRDAFEDGGFSVAARFTEPMSDPMSLQDLREAVRGRARRGLLSYRAEYDRLHLGHSPTKEQLTRAMQLERAIAQLYLYEGRFAEAASWMQKARETSSAAELPPLAYADLLAQLGIASLRRGELENCLECVGPSSCIFPISADAVHRNPSGSRDAVRWLTSYLDVNPGDLRASWLLMVAYMTLGEYPDQVPPQYRVPVDRVGSNVDVGRFENHATAAGLTAHGPNLAGGCLFDDFTGDGLPDLFTSSLDADLGASLYVNAGNGTFEDHSSSAGLGDQIYALNITRTDFDNDGDLDVLMMRGGWEFPLRLSLLRNRGDGSFEDVTVSSGLAEPIASESAAWGDYDNDGWLDLFLCGEYLPPAGNVAEAKPDPRNRCRLYHNERDGTFVNVAAQAGVLNERCAKGCGWGDYDGDGRLDLFVSNMRQPCRLYHNEGDGTFRDVAPKLGVTGPSHSFACWFWDFDNDGRLDLYVNDYRASTAECIASLMGVKIEGSSRPFLYHNLGPDGFREEAAALGLDRAMAPMGANFGDIDNDGYLDFYLGTGGMSYGGIMPNFLFKNMEGKRFEDVTVSSRTGHLQKGHGVAFADWDCDGDLDLFCELGGATPGDQSYNILMRNPGHGNHWLKVKLVGTKTNRAAIGASLRADLRTATGETRSIYRTIGNNSSFGGNPLVETLGLRDALRVDRLTVTWPTSQTTQTFTDIPADQAIEITEGVDSFKSLEQPRAGSATARSNASGPHSAG